MRGVEQSLSRIDRAAQSTHLSTGRLGNQFANLAGRIANVNPIIGNLANVLGDFAVGGLVTAGVLGGLAAIAVAYDQLTESSRKAMAQADKLTDALLRTARIRALGVGGEAQAAISDLAAGGGARQQRAGFMLGAAGVMPGIAPILEFLAGKDIAQAGQNAKAGQEAVNQYGLAIAAANEKTVEAAKAISEHARAEADKRRSAAERDAAEQLQLDKQISDLKLKIILEELHKIASLHAEIMGQIEFKGMPNVSMPFEGLDDKQKKQLQQLGVLTDDANKNAETIKGAIWGSANALAQTIVSSLNIGGGGKGSNLGGAIGSTAGFAVGFSVGGPVGGAIGSLIGNLGGSLIGGLFDNKRATDTNTQAIRANTAALLQNAPSVYKVARGRFDATNVKDFRESTVRYATRGGAPVMVVP